MTTNEYNDQLLSILVRVRQLDDILATLNNQRDLLLKEYDEAKEQYNGQA